MQPHTAKRLMETAGLYIHIPFCRSKCPYCAFVSAPCQGKPPSSYLEAIHKHISLTADNSWCREQIYSSIFIGGGTPTIYEGEEIGRLVKSCLANFSFSQHPEISVESNPNSVSAKKLEALKEAGVNRLSIGVQSFSDKILPVIGRSHDAKTAELAINLARRAGFDNLNLDFIYGLPGQTLADWRETLALALSCQPEHLALYEMTIEPDTPFAARAAEGKLNLPDEDELAEMEEVTVADLTAMGMTRYEISNYARPGRQCRHNINYWQNGSYLGLGAAAFSCFDGFRVKNVDDPKLYEQLIAQERSPFQEGEGLSEEAAFRESVITGLRMIEGVSIAALQKRYGFDPLTYYGKTVENFIVRNLLIIADGKLKLTEKSLPVANQVLSELV